ncbi:MAG TPA: hemolysin family protein [Bacteroidales bacterium]|nr:hemolysin family protein [Bacteroidales bacterium]
MITAFFIVLITLLLSAFFSGIEIAFVSSNKLKIELDSNNKKLNGMILSSFTKKPSKVIATLLIGNNIALVIYSLSMVTLIKPLIDNYISNYSNNDFFIILFQTILTTVIVLIFAEFLPKALFRLNPNKILNFFAVFLLIIYWVLSPIMHIFVKISETILKHIFKVKLQKQEYIFSTIDLENYLKEFSSTNHTNEKEDEIQMFQNVINLKKTKLRECMVPRTEIVAIEENEPIHTLRELYTKTGHSNILVYSENIDNIIGYVHAYDMFKKPTNIKDFLYPVIYLPETMPSGKALTKLIKQNKKLAIVVDEFGGTSGIVTIEDIIEEFVGEINDEFDVETLVEKKINDTEYIFSARIEIDYINNKYNLNLPVSEEYETIAGLILNFHQNIPKSGEEIIISNYKFKILQASKTKIEKVLLKCNIKL